MARQFTLRTMFAAVFVVACYCAAAVRWPLLAMVLAVPLGVYFLAHWTVNEDRGIRLGEVVLLLSIVGVMFALFVGLLLALFLPVVQSPRDAAPRNTCQNNLHQIAIALASYHTSHGCYPPPYVTDAQCRPLVSWRMLLLPYIDNRPHYDQWKQHRDEPWNGPNNIKLSQTEMEFFHCPSDPGPITDTSYVAIVGPGTILPRTGQVSNSQITDGLSNTLILVEVANSGINWMEPRDLDLTNRAPGINPKSGLGVSSMHPGVVCVQFADGRTTTVPESFSDQDLQALLTIAGGEKVVLP